ncbi:MAG TPA: M23 family metallopeptidase [Candidatus Omnitrophota bacterium]|nr:M23 family metallopeptidase [Candidatus Omnitrophota bacterium]
MAERKQCLDLRGRRAKAVKAIVERVLPEWQVFVRLPNGRGRHFTLSRDRQLTLLGGVAAMGLWAVASTLMLTHQPDALAAKERELEELLAANRAAQHRLAAAEKMVGEIAREVDSVHSSVVALAESNVSLVKDKPAAKSAVKVAARAIGAEPAFDDGALPGGSESKAVREQVRNLESSLERLRVATTRAVQQTADAAGERIAETGRQLSKLGLDPEKLVATERKRGGQGGPFIPVGAGPVHADDGLDKLMARMDHLNGINAALQRMPLAAPILADYEFNSGFGTRSDPLNHRTGVHEGVDFGAPVGTPVYATGGGTVTLAEPWDRYGNTVEIDHGNGVTTRYAHLSKIKVKEGQRVTRSTVIGLVGNTGRSTGPHLHYEVRVSDAPRDPVKFISVGRDAAKAR